MGKLFGADSVENQLANQMEHALPEVVDMGLSKNRRPQKYPTKLQPLLPTQGIGANPGNPVSPGSL